MPRFEPSRELFLLDGWFGRVFADDPDFPASLDPADDWGEEIGDAGDVALAANDVTPAGIDPLAVCVGVEYGDESPGLWTVDDNDARDWSLMCFSTYKSRNQLTHLVFGFHFREQIFWLRVILQGL